jgi:hypothetical protein
MNLKAAEISNRDLATYKLKCLVFENYQLSLSDGITPKQALQTILELVLEENIRLREAGVTSGAC